MWGKKIAIYNLENGCTPESTGCQIYNSEMLRWSLSCIIGMSSLEAALRPNTHLASTIRFFQSYIATVMKFAPLNCMDMSCVAIAAAYKWWNKMWSWAASYHLSTPYLSYQYENATWNKAWNWEPAKDKRLLNCRKRKHLWIVKFMNVFFR